MPDFAVNVEGGYESIS